MRRALIPLKAHLSASAYAGDTYGNAVSLLHYTCGKEISQIAFYKIKALLGNLKIRVQGF